MGAFPNATACMPLVRAGAMNMPGLVRAVGWVPARLCADLVRDLELRPHLMALLATPMAGATATGAPGGGAVGGAKAAKGGVGLLPASLGQRVGSAVWVSACQKACLCVRK